MRKPKVSIVIPLYNSQETVGKVLEAIKNLDFDKKEIEILFICYPLQNDNTYRIITNFIKANKNKYYDLRLIIRKDRRANFARNLGIRLSRGEYVLLLNDDIIIDPKSLRNALAILKTCPETAAVTFPYIAPHGSLSSIMFSKYIGKVSKVRTVALGCSIIRKSVFNDVGLINEKLGPPMSANDDLEFSARLHKAGYKIVIDGRCVALDIGYLKLKHKTYNTYTCRPGIASMIRQIIKVALKTLHYDFMIGGRTYHLVLKVAPLSWRLEILIYFLIPLGLILMLLVNPNVALIIIILILIISMFAYKPSTFKQIPYPVLILLRRISRAYGYIYVLMNIALKHIIRRLLTM